MFLGHLRGGGYINSYRSLTLDFLVPDSGSIFVQPVYNRFHPFSLESTGTFPIDQLLDQRENIQTMSSQDAKSVVLNLWVPPL